MECSHPQMADLAPRHHVLHSCLGGDVVDFDLLLEDSHLAVACLCCRLGCSTMVSGRFFSLCPLIVYLLTFWS